MRVFNPIQNYSASYSLPVQFNKDFFFKTNCCEIHSRIFSLDPRKFILPSLHYPNTYDPQKENPK